MRRAVVMEGKYKNKVAIIDKQLIQLISTSTLAEVTINAYGDSIVKRERNVLI